MGEYVLKIEKLENGYEVEVRDNEAEKKNSKKGNVVYTEPWKAYAFSTDKEVIAFITRRLAALPKSDHDEFNDAAEAAFKE
jgi:hypothetical protein